MVLRQTGECGWILISDMFDQRFIFNLCACVCAWVPMSSCVQVTEEAEEGTGFPAVGVTGAREPCDGAEN